MTHEVGGGRVRRIGVRGSILAVGAAGMTAAAAVGGFALSGLGGAGEALDDVTRLQGALTSVQEIQTSNADVTGWQTAYAWDARRVGGPAAVLDGNANRAGYLDSADRLRAQLEAVPTDVLSASERETFQQIEQNWEAFFAVDDQVVTRYAQGTAAGVEAGDALVVGDGYAVYFEVLQLTADLRESLQSRVEEAVVSADEEQTQAQWTMLAVIVLGALLALGLALAVARRIVRPLEAVASVAAALSDGDLTRSTGVVRDDEVGRTAAAIDSALGDLRRVMAAVAASADAVAASSEELSASSAQIAASAEETSAQSGVVAGAAEEVSRNVQ
ncbi:HAMP domain-containing protein, partial [Geodermatophilus sp. SYSU D00742]